MTSRLAALAAVVTMLASPAWCSASTSEALGVELGLWTLLPFAGFLLAIALMPLLAGHWWEHNRSKALVAALFALPIAIYLVGAHGADGAHALAEKAQEYVSFILLLGGLFVITGGIYVSGSLAGTPAMNTAIMLLGAVLANLIGTTGASVLLIRPLLRANVTRQRKVHIVVFFIFIVSNCGGLLTPLGDPPLFLGYLKGVPFGWTLRLLPQWALVVAVLLVIFNFLDPAVFTKEERERPGSQLEEVLEHEPLRIHGAHNFLFLLGIVGTILASGAGLMNGGEPWPFGVQEGAMAGFAILGWVTTSAGIRASNRFTPGPIVEVAVLFAGIFVTMAPALLVLNAWGRGEREIFGLAFGLEAAWQYFFATGGLSSFLDNAPTYLTFAATASGMEGISVEGRYLGELIARGPEAVQRLAAISCGAVFMGANTYIGNGPNFMVKAIAEENGVRMPGFFGYMVYSAVVLLPIFGLVALVFFR